MAFPRSRPTRQNTYVMTLKWPEVKHHSHKLQDCSFQRAAYGRQQPNSYSLQRPKASIVSNASCYYCASCLFRPNRCDHLEDSKCRESRASGIPSQTWPQTPPHNVFRFWPDRWSVVWLIGFPFLVTSVSPSLPPFLFWLLIFLF